MLRKRVLMFAQANSYSESANASRLMAEIAKANSMIAQAEHLLWTARRPPSKVAILYPRSSEMWDQFHLDKYEQTEPGGGHLCLCCCVSSMVRSALSLSLSLSLSVCVCVCVCV